MKLSGKLVDGRCKVFNADETFRLLKRRRRKMQQQGVQPANSYQRPVKVQVDFTNCCNLSCCFCYNSSGSKRLEEIDEADIERICRQLDELEVLEVVLSGGEIFCRSEKALQLVEKVAKHQIGLRIVTNGWYVDDVLAAHLSRYPVCDVQVSIDGADPAVHDRMRGRKRSWERAIRAVASLSRHGIPVSIACVLNNLNWKTIERLAELSYLLGAVRLIFADLINVGRALSIFDKLYLEDETYERAYEIISQLRQKYFGKIDVSLSTDMGVAMRFNVSLNDRICYIRPDGKVCPSCMIPIAFGDIHEEPLEVIWQRMRRLDRQSEVIRFIDRFELHETPNLNLIRSIYRNAESEGGVL